MSKKVSSKNKQNMHVFQVDKQNQQIPLRDKIQEEKIPLESNQVLTDNNRLEKIVINPSLMFRKRQWTQKQDKLLLNAIKKHGPKKWAFIAQFVPGRLGKQCRQRWHNHLNPKINKNQWNVKQQWLLFLMHTLYGGKWAKMTRILTQRTDNSIKNHWNSIMQKKLSSFKEKLDYLLNNHLTTTLDLKGPEYINLSQKLAENSSSVTEFHAKQKYLLKKLLEGNSKQQQKQQQSFQMESSLKQFQSFNNQTVKTSKISSQPLQEDIVLPQTSQDFGLKEKGFSFLEKKGSRTENQISFQGLLNKYQEPLSLLKKVSFNENLPPISLIKKSSQSGGIFDSNLKKKSNQSFIDKDQICKSPKMNARYSEIFPEDSQNYDDVLMPELQLNLLKRKSSKNYILTSPSKFMQKNRSSPQ